MLNKDQDFDTWLEVFLSEVDLWMMEKNMDEKRADSVKLLKLKTAVDIEILKECSKITVGTTTYKSLLEQVKLEWIKCVKPLNGTNCLEFPISSLDDIKLFNDNVRLLKYAVSLSDQLAIEAFFRNSTHQDIANMLRMKQFGTWKALHEFILNVGIVFPGSINSTKKVVKCVICGRDGHNSSQCWTEKVCNKCQRKGHIAKYCNSKN